MTKFIVRGQVKYKGVLYKSGSVVEVEDKDVKEFKKHGWQLVVNKTNKQNTPKQQTVTKNEDKTKDTDTTKDDTQNEQKDVK